MTWENDKTTGQEKKQIVCVNSSEDAAKAVAVTSTSNSTTLMDATGSQENCLGQGGYVKFDEKSKPGLLDYSAVPATLVEYIVQNRISNQKVKTPSDELPH